MLQAIAAAVNLVRTAQLVEDERRLKPEMSSDDAGTDIAALCRFKGMRLAVMKMGKMQRHRH